jgi:general secretion pathway protein G
MKQIKHHFFNTTSNQSNRSDKGLTLIEIIVVLVILSMLFVFLTGSLFSSGEGAKIRLNQMKMETLKQRINTYRFQYNTLPPSLASLTACDQNTGPQCSPLASEEDTKDAWGTPFRYQITGGGRTYTVTSLGSDGQQGGSEANADATVQGP